MGPFIHFKMYKVVAFVLSFTVIATYGFKLEANEASTRKEGCIVPSWRGDNYCDDGNNNKACGYDGGDCCGSNTNKTYCQTCQCLDPNIRGPLILVVTGNKGGGYTDESQVIDISSKKVCNNLEPYPIKMVLGGGFLLDGVPLVCGGYGLASGDKSVLYHSVCHTYDKLSNKWKFLTNMNTPKRAFSRGALVDGAFWAIGGYGNGNILSSTEYIFPNGTVTWGPNLPSPRYQFCSITLHDRRVMLIGGIGKGRSLRSVITFNPEDNTFTTEPDMIDSRNSPACALFYSSKHGNRPVVLAIGGDGRVSAEILDYTNENANGWEKITPLPTKHVVAPSYFFGASALTSLSGNGVYIQYNEYFYELQCSTTSCDWTIMEQTLGTAVRASIMMYLPSGYTC